MREPIENTNLLRQDSIDESWDFQRLLRGLNDYLNGDVCTEAAKYFLMALVVISKMASSTALIHQGLKGTLKHVDIKDKIAETIIAVSIISNLVSTGLTRFPAVYRNFFEDSEILQPNNLGSREKFTRVLRDFVGLDSSLTHGQNFIAVTFKILGVLSLICATANTQSALTELIYHICGGGSFSSTHQKIYMQLLAGIFSSANAISFMCFKSTKININAEKFAGYLQLSLDYNRFFLLSADGAQQFKDHFKIILAVIILTIINIISNLGNNYYPSEKSALFFLGAALAESAAGKLGYVLPSLIAGASSTITTGASECLSFITNDPIERISKLNKSWVYILGIFIILDMIGSGFAGFVGSLNVLMNFLGFEESIMLIAAGIFLTTVNTLLNIPFNQIPAFESAARISFSPDSDKEEETPHLESVDTTETESDSNQKPPLLAQYTASGSNPHSFWNGASINDNVQLPLDHAFPGLHYCSLG